MDRYLRLSGSRIIVGIISPACQGKESICWPLLYDVQSICNVMMMHMHLALTWFLNDTPIETIRVWH